MVMMVKDKDQLATLKRAIEGARSGEDKALARVAFGVAVQATGEGGFPIKATAFNVRVSRDDVVFLFEHDLIPRGVSVMCKEYLEDDPDWCAVEKGDLDIDEAGQLKTFELWY